MLFTDFGLKPGLVKALEGMGYAQPTPIQEQVMTHALKGRNIVGQSQTGTGKTAAFLIPLLNKIDTNKKGLQALIIAPTRELVNQISDEIFALTKFYRVNAVCVFGGSSVTAQARKLRGWPTIVVATPGRLMDFIQQRLIDPAMVKYFVLDEVDRMLDMGFVRDIEKIWGMCTQIQQTYTFSATLQDNVKKIIKAHIPEYEFIKVGEAVTVDKIDHSYMHVAHEDKLANVIDLINHYHAYKVIIFTQTKKNTETIYDILAEQKLPVGVINGDMRQNKRTLMLKAYKEGKIKILVTTDVAARGLNMDNVGLVINFDVPIESESYIHRIGRTGRAGASGRAIMLVSELERALLQHIEKRQNIRIKKSDIHTGVKDDAGAHKHIRLNRTTDKKGGGKRFGGRDSGGFGSERGRGGYGDRKPTYGGDRKSSYGEKKPAYGDRKSSYGEKKPAYGDRKSSYGEKKPTYGDRKPTYGDRKPTYGDRKPTGGRDRDDGFFQSDRPRSGRPSRSSSDTPYHNDANPRRTSDKKSSYGDKKTSYGDRKPVYGDKKSSYGDRKSSSGRRVAGR